jgi:hypothetical protein
MKKRKLKVTLGIFLSGIGAVLVIPPPDLDLLVITGLTISGVPLKYSIPSVYIGGILLLLIGSFLVGKNLSDILKINKKGGKDGKESSKINRERKKRSYDCC